MPQPTSVSLSPPPPLKLNTHPYRPPPPRHTDWISCCALVPSATAGVAPSVAVSGGRDGSVRFWHKSATAAAEAAAARAALDALAKESAQGKRKSGLRAAFASGSRSSSGRDLGSGGVGGGGGGLVPAGDGGWSLASSMAMAHGSSEFVTCCASPLGPSGAAAGWVATGGTDWSVSRRPARVCVWVST